MTEMDISRLSAGERLDLIGRLWDSLETDDIALTPAQHVELDRRLETADAESDVNRCLYDGRAG
jgi:putative addiction module component (TIGR02574 family)